MSGISHGPGRWRTGLRFIVALLLATACSAPPEGVRPVIEQPEALLPGIDADVTWLGDDQLMVVLRLDPAALPPDHELVEWRFRSKYLGEDYAERVVEVLDEDRIIPWENSLGQVSVPETRRYRVQLEFSEEHAAFGRGGIHFPITGGWHLLGRAFLPDLWVDGQPVAVPARLDIDPAEQLLISPWGQGHQQFESSSLIDLADTFFVMGAPTAFQTHTVDISDTTLMLYSSDLESQDLVAMAQLSTRALAQLEGLLGPIPEPSLMVGFYAVGTDDYGTASRNAAIQTGPFGAPKDLGSRTGSVYVHELVHFWIPGSFTIFEQWLDEGFTDYFAIRALNDLRHQPELAVAEVVFRAWQNYAAPAEEAGATVNDDDPTGTGRWHYDAGIVVAYCLDTMLASHETSIAEVMRQLLTLHPASSQLGAEHLRQALEAVDPAVARALDAMLQHQGAIEFGSCLQRAGFDVVDHEFDGLQPREVALEVLKATGLQTQSKLQGMGISQVLEGSQLQVGDVVRLVGNIRVATLSDVAFALADVDAGGRFDVVVERSGARLVLPHTMPDIAPEKRSKTSYQRPAPISADGHNTMEKER